MRHHHGAFETHVREAIALNGRRAWRYARASRGRTLPVSVALIASEVMILPVARWFDHRARRWMDAGLPLLDGLFTSMSEAPAQDAPASPVMPGAYLSQHLVESAERVASHMTGLDDRSAMLGLPSPRPLLESLRRLHLRGLVIARVIDRLARPAHERRVPILVNDLPPIRCALSHPPDVVHLHATLTR